MTIYGYCRVSTPKQKLERQIKNIKKAYPQILDKDIFLEEWTGTTTERPMWKKLERKLKTGDTVVFDSVSRMSRQAKEGFDLYKKLYEKGISLVFLKEATINTANYSEALKGVNIPNIDNEDLKPLFDGLRETVLRLQKRQFFQAFEQAEKEVEDLRQRTREGFTPEARKKLSDQAKAKTGKKLTTKKSLEMKPKIRKMAKAFEGNLTDKEVIEYLKMRPATYYKYKKELKAELIKEKE